MAKTLTEIAQELKNSQKKVQLVYAFNGTGKTRLSKAFQNLVAPKEENDEAGETRKKILYYNAFTEDLFYWDNDLNQDAEPKLKIQPNSFTRWIFEEQGLEQQVISNFQHYTDKKLTPSFNKEYKVHDHGREITISAFSEVTFSFTRGDDTPENNIKISKGEESNFIWSVFYTLLNQVIEELQVAEPSERSTDQFNDLEYVFIDDPVSSLDENHLIELAVNLAQLVKSCPEQKVKFLVTTHNPLFYNVLYNELQLRSGYILKRNEDGTFELEEKRGDSNKSFSYHLFLKQMIEEAIENNGIQKYHFMILRNLYEKTANFLGYPKWSELLPDNKTAYYNRIIQFTSHSTLSNEVVAEPTEPEKQTVKFLLTHLTDNYHFWNSGNAS